MRSCCLIAGRIASFVPIRCPSSPRRVVVTLNTKASIRMVSSDASRPAKLLFAPGDNATSSTENQNTTDQHQHQHQQAAQFKIGTLARKDLDADPFKQFYKWYSDPALSDKNPETVTLSTAELPSGRVSSRMVYLKELDDKGFVIYSNWGTSQKAHDIETNPYASLCFWWKPLERQVRVSGPAYRISKSESQLYYDTRARGSRIGAWASQQSDTLRPSGTTDVEDDGRKDLEDRVKAVEQKFEGVEKIPVPDFWGGLRVVPERIEFWQGRDSRLHDRFEYRRDSVDSDDWRIQRLSP